MQKKVAIGLLLPSSTITPMGKDFETGIKKGLTKLMKDDEWEVELIAEFISQGSKEKVETAVNKLIGYNNADIITGIVSNKSGFEVADKFEKGKKLFLINNLGEHLPDPRQYNSNVFLNSINLWQQIWALGYWGVKTFGKKGMFVSGLYDAGYSFSSMLQSGMYAADPESKMSFAIAPVSKVGDLADIESVFQYIELYNPDFIMAAFCGEEAGIFLKEYLARGYHKTKPLLGLPFLIQPFESEDNIEVYTTIASNVKLYDNYADGYEKIANNPFPQLGYETGLLIAEALQAGGVSALKDSLTKIEVKSERGPISINVNDTGNNTNVYLIKNTYNGDIGQVQRKLCEEIKTTKINSAEIEKQLNEFSSGWFNPYLGV